MGGVDIRDGGVFTPDGCGCWRVDMIDRGIRCRVRLADAMLGCEYEWR
jgi:hypothetical protein